MSIDTRESVLQELSEDPALFVTLWLNNPPLIDGLIFEGLVQIKYGARRSEDLLYITDAGRAVLEAADGT